MAHRLSWELHYGKIPAGMNVCHRCDNPPCVRPDHLFLGTQVDNMADMMSKGRNPKGDNRSWRLHPELVLRGSSHPRSKLTEDQVRKAKKDYITGTIYRKDLAKSLGVSEATVKDFLRGATWKHVI
jgi:hypothetical protein